MYLIKNNSFYSLILRKQLIYLQKLIMSILQSLLQIKNSKLTINILL